MKFSLSNSFIPAADTIDDETEDPFVSLSDSDVEQEAINELDSDDENDEIIDI